MRYYRGAKKSFLFRALRHCDDTVRLRSACHVGITAIIAANLLVGTGIGIGLFFHYIYDDSDSFVSNCSSSVECSTDTSVALQAISSFKSQSDTISVPLQTCTMPPNHK